MVEAAIESTAASPPDHRVRRSTTLGATENASGLGDASYLGLDTDRTYVLVSPVTSQGHPGARLKRALERGNLIAAEQAAFEVAFVPIAQARQLVELYAEKGDPKYERAALKYLRRYMDEALPEPTLADIAQVAAVLAERATLMKGG